MSKANTNKLFPIQLAHEETRMLWQLLNNPNVAVGAADAKVMGRFYDKAKAAADFHGHTAPAPKAADDKA